MKRFTLRLALLIVMLAAVPAQARWRVGNTTCTAVNCKLLDAVASNAAAALRTFTIDVTGFVKLDLQIDYVYSSGTAVTLTCTRSMNQGSSYGSITSRSIAGGASTLSALTETFAIAAASANFTVELDVRGYDKYQCVVGVTGGGAGDTITAYANASRYNTNEQPAVR